MQTPLEVIGLSKIYDKKKAVKDITSIIGNTNFFILINFLF